LSSIPNDVVVSRVSKLGVSLGVSPSKVSKSIQFIKESDNTRTLIMLKRIEEKDRLDVQHKQISVLDHATDLSSDLGEEEQQGSEDH
jgi:hypothetical protein